MKALHNYLLKLGLTINEIQMEVIEQDIECNISTVAEIKQQAKALHDSLFFLLGITIKHAHLLEAVAKYNGFYDWNTCVAFLKEHERVQGLVY